MRRLPSGIVTFLFTDVEGSTRLIDELGPEAYGQALLNHRTVLRDAVSSHGGVEVGTEGDAFFAAFTAATEAVRAAVQAQEALAEGHLQVRMGLHTGTAEVVDDDYVGADVHRAARIAAAGHGGQILLSSQTAGPLESLELIDLGEHRLKDVSEPVAILQVGPGRFPPLRTISNTNLPRPASSFVGRQREVSEIAALLRKRVRLLTLTGPGGSGKTRLAIEAATGLVPEFKSGVFWVGLASIIEPALVLPTIAQTVGAKNGLPEHFEGKEMLLVLDNLEQAVGVAPELAHLIERCPGLSLMVTSRELLRVRGEREFAVPPLAPPEAVELFCVLSGAEFDHSIAELCTRLDNLPLAIELAAARARVLSPKEILGRLHERLDLLQGGRDADPRQQTLRATIDWSYQLLSGEERRLFRRLAAFPGGCTLETAERVLGAGLTTVAALLDKSLIQARDGWFSMLETIRQFASERLQASGEADQLAEQHARDSAEFARQVRALLSGPDQDQWRKRAVGIMTNFRAALEYAAAHESGLAVAIASGVQPIWALNGDQNEALALIDKGLAASTNGRTEDRARALADRAAARLGRGEARPSVEAELDEAERLAEEAGDPWARYRVLEIRAELAAIDRQIGRYLDLLRQGLEALDQMGIPWASRPRYLMAIELADNGHLDEALAMADILEAGATAARDRWGVEKARYLRARIAYYRGDLEEALALASGVIEWAESVGSMADQLAPLTVLAFTASERSNRAAVEGIADRGDRLLAELGHGGTFACYAVARANARLKDRSIGMAVEALKLAAESGSGELCQELRVLDLGALILAELGEPDEAAQLLAEADALHQIAGTKRVPIWERHVQGLRADGVQVATGLSDVPAVLEHMFSALRDALAMRSDTATQVPAAKSSAR